MARRQIQIIHTYGPLAEGAIVEVDERRAARLVASGHGVAPAPPEPPAEEAAEAGGKPPRRRRNKGGR